MIAARMIRDERNASHRMISTAAIDTAPFTAA